MSDRDPITKEFLQAIAERPLLETSTLAHLVRAQADRLFPNRTTHSMFLKLYSEIGELVDDPASPGELADCFIMLLDHAERFNINIVKAVVEKMIVNEERTWTQTQMGVMKHVK